MLENIQIMKVVSVNDKFDEGCSENIDGNEMIYNGSLNDDKKVCNSCTVHTVLSAMLFIISINISSIIIYFHSYLKSDTNITNINPGTEAVIY